MLPGRRRYRPTGRVYPLGGGGKYKIVVYQKINTEVQSIRVDGSGIMQTKVGLVGRAL